MHTTFHDSVPAQIEHWRKMQLARERERQKGGRWKCKNARSVELKQMDIATVLRDVNWAAIESAVSSIVGFQTQICRIVLPSSYPRDSHKHVHPILFSNRDLCSIRLGFSFTREFHAWSDPKLPRWTLAALEAMKMKMEYSHPSPSPGELARRGEYRWCPVASWVSSMSIITAINHIGDET
jgi:hypothetical protein